MGVPPNHPFKWNCPLKTIHLGVPPFMETPKWSDLFKNVSWKPTSSQAESYELISQSNIVDLIRALHMISENNFMYMQSHENRLYSCRSCLGVQMDMDLPTILIYWRLNHQSMSKQQPRGSLI